MSEGLISSVKDFAIASGVVSIYMFAVFGCLFFAH